jgi:hypothetical protein
MKELTLEQFFHDCELLAATHSKEEIHTIYTDPDMWSELMNYRQWCAYQILCEAGLYQNRMLYLTETNRVYQLEQQNLLP